MQPYTGDTKRLHCDLAFWFAYFMAKSKVTVKGAKELKAAFAKLKAAARGPALMTAAKTGILPIQNAAIENAPYLTGTLKRSIHTEELQQSDFFALVATGTDLEYAARVEFGFNDTDALGRTYHQSARPYMRPAYDNERDAAISETTDALRDLILSAV